MWDTDGAARELERRRVAADIGPCPNCGADAEVDLMDVVSTGGGVMWVPGEVSCSARCYEEDPAGYLRAVQRQDPA